MDGRGIPLSLVVSGAETPDVSLVAETLAKRIVRRAKAYAFPPQYLSGEKGDTGEAAGLYGRAATEATGSTPCPGSRWVASAAHTSS